MDIRTKLTVLHDDGGVFTDHSNDSQDFKRDTFNIQLTTDDYIYIGFRKDINAIYSEIVTANTIASDLTIEYHRDDSTWVTLSASDDTKGFTRSGFITWERPEDGLGVAVDGKDMCWVRISSSANIDNVEFQAINLLFSDDNDICSEVPALVDSCFYQQGQTSHILHHVASKNYIMSRLRGRGYIKETPSGEENIDQWDVLDIYELRQASTYYAIAQIYFNLSDTVEDQYWAKYKEYTDKFEEAFALGRLRIDQDDDGQVDVDEKRPVKHTRWFR